MNPGGDPLAQLRPLHLPPEPGLWPPAPGWWLLAAAVMALLCLTVWATRRWQQRRARRRLPLQALANLETRAAALDDRQLLAQAAALLRRVALHRQMLPTPALAGDDWARFLAERADPDSPAELWRLLADDRYKAQVAAVDRPALFRACAAWINRTGGHHAGA